MWITLSLLAAITAGTAVIFQKKGSCGSNIIQISAIHLLAVFITVFVVTLLSGDLIQLPLIPLRCWWLTVASGIVQAFSWIAYFLAMKEANVSFIMVLDKAGIIVTMLLAAILLNEKITFVMLLGSILILLGTYLMANLKNGRKQVFSRENRWIIYGLLSPSLQALSMVITKMDTANVDTSLTTSIRMFVVTVTLLLFACIKEGSLRKLKQLGAQNLLMLILGGIILGLSYLMMYRAIYLGPASIVTAIVRSNFLVTTILAVFVFGEKLSLRELGGFLLVCFGVILFIV